MTPEQTDKVREALDALWEKANKDYESQGGDYREGYCDGIEKALALLDAEDKPSPEPREASAESWIKQIAPVVRKALCHAINNLPALDMGTTYDEDVRIECREALEALNRMEGALLSAQQPEKTVPMEMLVALKDEFEDEDWEMSTVREILRRYGYAVTESGKEEGR